MSPIVNYAADAVGPGFPAALELHWEIENRFVWNEHERANEERELVTKLAGLRNSVPGGVFCGRSGKCRDRASPFSFSYFSPALPLPVL